MVTIKGVVAKGIVGGSDAEPKFCHPSVCVGGTQPTNCVCPTTPAK